MINRLKSRWVLIPAAFIVLAIGVLGAGVVAAQAVNEDSHKDRFTARVAEILGLDETDVKDAMTQAKRQLYDEAVQAKLDAMVAAGEITQDQADEYKTWIDSRPEGLGDRGWFGRGRHGKGFHKGRHHR